MVIRGAMGVPPSSQGPERSQKAGPTEGQRRTEGAKEGAVKDLQASHKSAPTKFQATAKPQSSSIFSRIFSGIKSLFSSPQKMQSPDRQTDRTGLAFTVPGRTREVPVQTTRQSSPPTKEVRLQKEIANLEEERAKLERDMPPENTASRPDISSYNESLRRVAKGKIKEKDDEIANLKEDLKALQLDNAKPLLSDVPKPSSKAEPQFWTPDPNLMRQMQGNTPSQTRQSSASQPMTASERMAKSNELSDQLNKIGDEIVALKNQGITDTDPRVATLFDKQDAIAGQINNLRNPNGNLIAKSNELSDQLNKIGDEIVALKNQGITNTDPRVATLFDKQDQIAKEIAALRAQIKDE